MTSIFEQWLAAIFDFLRLSGHFTAKTDLASVECILQFLVFVHLVQQPAHPSADDDGL